MKKFPIAIQLYSVRDVLEENTEATLKELKGYGYNGVEFAGLCGKTPSELAKITAKSGLEPISAHVSIGELRADIKKVIADYKTLGCKHIVLPGVNQDERPGNENFPLLLKDMRAFGEALTDAGFVFSYHNHDFEFVKIGGEFGFDIIYQTIPQELLKVQQDTCWVAVAGESPVAYLEKYANRSPLLHLKDYFGKKSDNMYKLIGIDEKLEASENEAFELRPLGCGVQDFKSIIEAAERAKVEWLIVEQDEPSMGKTRMESAKISRDYLESIGY